MQGAQDGRKEDVWSTSPSDGASRASSARTSTESKLELDPSHRRPYDSLLEENQRLWLENSLLRENARLVNENASLRKAVGMEAESSPPAFQAEPPQQPPPPGAGRGWVWPIVLPPSDHLLPAYGPSVPREAEPGLGAPWPDWDAMVASWQATPWVLQQEQEEEVEEEVEEDDYDEVLPEPTLPQAPRRQTPRKAKTQAGGDSVETDDTDGRRTTVMLRNLPNNYSRAMVVQMMSQEGFAAAFNFLYLPIDFRTGACLGYAFVNLVSREYVAPFWKRFDGYCDWHVPSKKRCSVTWSGPHQGYHAHVERYRSSPIMHSSVPEHYRPAVFQNGRQVPFPAPIKVPRAPRMRHYVRGGLAPQTSSAPTR